MCYKLNASEEIINYLLFWNNLQMAGIRIPEAEDEILRIRSRFTMNSNVINTLIEPLILL